MDDHYRTLAATARFRCRIERSEFLAIGFPVNDEPEFMTGLDGIEKEFFDATHHCWAFRLRERSRSSDAGEPTGTAGRQILAAIDGIGVVEAAVVVVRWYGGVKLGTGGLSRAYRETAAEMLAGATIEDRYLYERFGVEVSYEQLGVAYRLASPPAVVLVSEEFGERNRFEFDVRLSRGDEFAASLTERRMRFDRTSVSA